MAMKRRYPTYICMYEVNEIWSFLELENSNDVFLLILGNWQKLRLFQRESRGGPCWYADISLVSSRPTNVRQGEEAK